MDLNTLEIEVLDYFLSLKSKEKPEIKKSKTSGLVQERAYTRTGFFTDFKKLDPLKVDDKNDTYIFSKLGAKINNQIETGFLLYIKDAHIICLEGFAYEASWPENIEQIELYTLPEK